MIVCGLGLCPLPLSIAHNLFKLAVLPKDDLVSILHLILLVSKLCMLRLWTLFDNQFYRPPAR